MFNKAMQELVKIAGLESERPTLAGLYFKGNKVVATDGHKLMEVTVPKYALEDIIELTTNFNFIKEDEIDFMIPSRIIKSLKIPKTSFNKEVTNKAYFGNIQRAEDGTLEKIGILTNDLDKEVITQTRVLKGKFPDYHSFFENDGTLKIGVNVDNLIDTLTVFKKLGHKSLKFILGTSLQPIIIEGDETQKNIESKAIVMPLKI